MLRRAWFLILCMLATSMAATASVHAQEGLGVAATVCAGELHVDGDADQVPADDDQPVTHHHGTCHGHSLTAPVSSAFPVAGPIVREARNASVAARLPSLPVGPALEPPRA